MDRIDRNAPQNYNPIAGPSPKANTRGDKAIETKIISYRRKGENTAKMRIHSRILSNVSTVYP